MTVFGATDSSTERSFRQLTSREIEVLDLLARGIPNKEIASQLCLSEKTIRNCVSEVLEKLCLRNRTQLAIWAWEEGVVYDQASEQEMR